MREPSLETVIIKLPENPLPLALEHSLRSAGIKFRYIDGVRVFSLDAPLQKSSIYSFHIQHLRLPLLGEVGCTLAHRAAYSHFLSSKAEWLLVFEEDAILEDPREFQRGLSSLVDLGDQSNVVMFSYQHSSVLAQYRGNSHLTRCLVPPMLTSCYAINRKAARTALSRTSELDLADWPWWMSEVSFWAVRTRSVETTNQLEISNIGKRGPAERGLIGRLIGKVVFTFSPGAGCNFVTFRLKLKKVFLRPLVFAALKVPFLVITFRKCGFYVY